MLSKDLQKRGFVEWLTFNEGEKSQLFGKFPHSDFVAIGQKLRDKLLKVRHRVSMKSPNQCIVGLQLDH